MATRSRIKTEHAGAENGGGYYGTRVEAKAESRVKRRHDDRVAVGEELDTAHGTTVVTSMAGGQPQAWTGPPAGLFYFTLRSDAIDVVYGTQRGFENLGVPYMAHIAPPSRWGE